MFPEDILEAYKFTFSQPGALNAAINYYRCMMSSRKKEKQEKQEEALKKIKIPTLIIWVCKMDCLKQMNFSNWVTMLSSLDCFKVLYHRSVYRISGSCLREIFMVVHSCSKLDICTHELSETLSLDIF